MPKNLKIAVGHVSVVKKIPMKDIVYSEKFRRFMENDAYWEKIGNKILEALKKDMNDPRYQWVFIPVSITPSKTLWHVGDGKHRFCIHKKLELKTINAYVLERVIVEEGGESEK